MACPRIVGQARGQARGLRRPLRPPFFFRKTGIFEEERGHGPRAGRGPAPRFPQMRSIFAKTKRHWAESPPNKSPYTVEKTMAAAICLRPAENLMDSSVQRY